MRLGRRTCSSGVGLKIRDLIVCMVGLGWDVRLTALVGGLYG